MRQLGWMLLGLALVVMAGCGFHLRGAADLPDSIKTLFIQGVDLSQTRGRALKEGLENNGVTVVSQYQAGQAVMTITENIQERRVLSVGSDAKVSEYELYSALRFSLTDGQGKALLADQLVESQRDYQFDQTQVLSADEEERLLREQMDQQLVQSVLRRLSALK